MEVGAIGSVRIWGTDPEECVSVSPSTEGTRLLCTKIQLSHSECVVWIKQTPVFFFFKDLTEEKEYRTYC